MVYIEDFKMPVSCKVCKMNICGYCCLTYETVGFKVFEKEEHCPLSFVDNELLKKLDDDLK